MTKLLRLVLFALVVLWLPAQQVSAQTTTFAHPEIAREAQRYENELATKTAAASRPQTRPDRSREEGAECGRCEGSGRRFRSGRCAAPENAETWLLSREPSWPHLPTPIVPASVTSCPPMRAPRPILLISVPRACRQAQALAVLGRALQYRSFWRPALML